MPLFFPVSRTLRRVDNLVLAFASLVALWPSIPFASFYDRIGLSLLVCFTIPPTLSSYLVVGRLAYISRIIDPRLRKELSLGLESADFYLAMFIRANRHLPLFLIPVLLSQLSMFVLAIQDSGLGATCVAMFFLSILGLYPVAFSFILLIRLAGEKCKGAELKLFRLILSESAPLLIFCGWPLLMLFAHYAIAFIGALVAFIALLVMMSKLVNFRFYYDSAKLAFTDTYFRRIGAPQPEV